MSGLRHIPLWLLLAVAPGAAAQGIYPGDAVRVNDETISYQRFHGFYLEYRNSSGVQVGARGDQLQQFTQLRREAMELMIEQELVKQAAEAAGIHADPQEVEQHIAQLREVFDNEDQFRMKLEEDGFTEDSYHRHIERMTAAKVYLDRIRERTSKVADAEVEQFYRDNPERLTLPPQVRVRHILLVWKPMGTQDDRAAIHAQMAPILARARAGEDFAALAREYSEDSATRDSGGDTGYFYPGTMVRAFEDTAFALQPGEISDPLSTAFGVHILKLEGRKPPRMLPLEQVREQLRDYLREEKMQAAVAAKIDQLRAGADTQVLIPVAANH
jgi:peptidyl-prolyl cis-trans isomerase C